MGRQEARFQPGDHACLVTWKSSFFPLYQLHAEILEQLDQAIVFRKGSPICMEEFKDLRVFIHVNSDDYLERHYTEEAFSITRGFGTGSLIGRQSIEE